VSEHAIFQSKSASGEFWWFYMEIYWSYLNLELNTCLWRSYCSAMRVWWLQVPLDWVYRPPRRESRVRFDVLRSFALILACYRPWNGWLSRVLCLEVVQSVHPMLGKIARYLATISLKLPRRRWDVVRLQLGYRRPIFQAGSSRRDTGLMACFRIDTTLPCRPSRCNIYGTIHCEPWIFDSRDEILGYRIHKVFTLNEVVSCKVVVWKETKLIANQNASGWDNQPT